MLEAIRPQFIRGHHVLMQEGWAERNDLVRQRDDEHRALNLEFGVMGSASYQGQSDPQYDRRYKLISSAFRPKYDAISAREEAWKQEHRMTIPECLFLDNPTPDLKILCARRDFDELHYFSFIKAKAEIAIAEWKSEFNFAGLNQRVNIEIRLFQYVRKRCCARYSIQPWHLRHIRQIATYRKVWIEELRETLGRLRAA